MGTIACPRLETRRWQGARAGVAPRRDESRPCPRDDRENEMTRHLLLGWSWGAAGLGAFALIAPTILLAEQAPTEPPAPQSPPPVNGPAAHQEMPEVQGKSDDVEWVRTAIAAPVHTAPSVSTSIFTYYPAGTRL